MRCGSLNAKQNKKRPASTFSYCVSGLEWTSVIETQSLESPHAKRKTDMIHFLTGSAVYRGMVHIGISERVGPLSWVTHGLALATHEMRGFGSDLIMSFCFTVSCRLSPSVPYCCSRGNAWQLPRGHATPCPLSWPMHPGSHILWAAPPVHDFADSGSVRLHLGPGPKRHQNHTPALRCYVFHKEEPSWRTIWSVICAIKYLRPVRVNPLSGVGSRLGRHLPRGNWLKKPVLFCLRWGALAVSLV